MNETITHKKFSVLLLLFSILIWLWK